MSWSRFSWVFIGLVVLGIALFGYFRLAEKLLSHELENWQSEIEARNDGSYLRYEGLDAKGTTATLDELSYYDAKKDTHILVYGLSLKGTPDEIEELHADHFSWRGANQELASFDHILAKNLRQNPDANHGWDQYLFDVLQAENLFMRGKSNSDLKTDLRAETFALNGFDQDRLEDAWVTNIRLEHSDKTAATSKEIHIHELNYAKIEDVFASIDAGYLPLAPLSDYVDLDVEGFSLEFNGEPLLQGDKLNISEEDMLEFFMKNAPEELQDFVGTTDGAELLERLQELENKDSDEVAIDMLQFMLDFLKNQQK